jgi:hypothetical protein
MYWNHRFVNCPSKNGGEDWYELKEVYYDNLGLPIACTENAVDVCGESMEEMYILGYHLVTAWDKPILHEKLFTTTKE